MQEHFCYYTDMNCIWIFILCHALNFIFIFDLVFTLENKIEISTTSKLNILIDDSSHEDKHSKNGPTIQVQNNFTTKPTGVNINKEKTKTSINTNKQLNILASVKPVTRPAIIATEGGNIPLSDTLKNKILKEDTLENKTESKPRLNTKLTESIPKLISSNAPKHKKIHGRPGVIFQPEVSSTFSPSSTTTSTEANKAKKKPVFTIVKETDVNESFIESKSGKDYVLPIVLIILAFPIIAYIIKLIYRRGTEFTERQQYHRMYLIDGMYNSR